MANETLARRIKSLIVEELGVDESEVTSSASFVGDLGADSLDLLELKVCFEEEFGIAISADDAVQVGTVAEAITYIEQKTTP